MATSYKILGQWCAATSRVNMYECPAGKSAVVSTLHIANITSTAAKATVNILYNGAAVDNANYLVKDVTIPANGFYALTEGITLSAGDKINVVSDTNNALAFQAFGSEIA